MPANYDIIWTAKASPSGGGIGVGTVCVISSDGATYKPAVTANTAAISVPAGIAISETGPDGSFTLQHSGVIHAEVTGLGAGTKSAVIASPTTGMCVRKASPTVSDVIVGIANERGDVLFGASASAAGTSFTAAGDLTGDGTSQTVVKVNGISISGTPAAGDAPIATGATSAVWGAQASAVIAPVNPKLSFGATGNGSTNDRTALVNAAATATGKSLVYNAGTYLVSSTLSFGSDVGHWFEQGSKIDAPGQTVTFNGPIFAHPLQQIFTPTTVVRFGDYQRRIPRVTPYWWGAKGDGVTDDGPALQAMFDSVTGLGWNGASAIDLPAGCYATRTQLNIVGRNGASFVCQGEGASYGKTGSVIKHLGSRIASSTNPSGTVVVFTTSDPHGMSTLDNVTVRGHTGNSAMPTSTHAAGQVTVYSTTTFSIDGLLGNGGSAGGATGTAGGAVLQMKGVNNSHFRDIVFDGNGVVNTGVWYRTNQLAGQGAANGVYFSGCGISGFRGKESAGMRIGELGANTGGNTYQAAQVVVDRNTWITGAADATSPDTASYYAWIMLQGGNDKDHAITSGNFEGCCYGVHAGWASGGLVVDNVQTTNMYFSTVVAGPANVSIRNMQIENANGTSAGGFFVSGSSAGGSGNLAIRDCTVVSPVWDQSVDIASSTNPSGAPIVITTKKMHRFLVSGQTAVITGHSNALANGTFTATRIDENRFSINQNGDGSAAGTASGEVVNGTNDGVFIGYDDHLTLENNYLDGGDEVTQKIGPPMVRMTRTLVGQTGGGSLWSEGNTYRFSHLEPRSSRIAIASSTNTTPIQVTTSAAHGMIAGQKFTIQQHRTNTAANGAWKVGTVLSTTSFTVVTTAGANSVGTAVGGAQGFVLRSGMDTIPVIESETSALLSRRDGNSTYYRRNIFSRGDTAGDNGDGTLYTLAPLDGAPVMVNSLIQNHSVQPAGVVNVRLGDNRRSDNTYDIDYKTLALYPYGGLTTHVRLALVQTKANVPVRSVFLRVITPFTGTSMTTALARVGRNNSTYFDSYIRGTPNPGVDMFGGVQCYGVAANLLYGAATADLGDDLLSANLVQGLSFNGLASPSVMLTFTTNINLSAMTAGKLRVYISYDQLTLDD